jgi:hypothetical protein
MLSAGPRTAHYGRRIGGVLVLAFAWVQALPGVAHAHPVGSTPWLERASLVTGGVLVAGGVLALVRAASKDGGRGLQIGGAVLGVLGLVLLVTGPRVVRAVEGGSCGGRPSTTATLNVHSPVEGGVFTTTKVPVEVSVTGGSIASAETTQIQADSGHIHISVDGALQAMVGAERQEIEVPEGTHDITVEYSAGDHGPFCTPIQVSRRIEVKP